MSKTNLSLRNTSESAVSQLFSYRRSKLHTPTSVRQIAILTCCQTDIVLFIQFYYQTYALI